MAWRQESITAEETRVKVDDFFRSGGERLRMRLLAGESGLGREIPEPLPFRPGLALTGYFAHFAPGRIQVFGFAEYGYLGTLPEGVRTGRLKDFFAQGIPCVVVARGQEVYPEMARLAGQCGVPVLVTPLETKIFIHNATFVLEDLQAPRRKVHGTMLEVAGIGVFIEGDAGVGKSETALGLVMRGHALVADDLTEFRRDANGNILASACGVSRNFMEIRGLGILDVPAIFGIAAVRGEKQVDLVVTLKRQSPELDELDRTGIEEMTRDVLGVRIPQRVISVAPGRDLVNLVETAARNHKLRMSGVNAAQTLEERIMRHHLEMGKGVTDGRG